MNSLLVFTLYRAVVDHLVLRDPRETKDLLDLTEEEEIQDFVDSRENVAPEGLLEIKDRMVSLVHQEILVLLELLDLMDNL